jgi:hypothetical protein
MFAEESTCGKSKPDKRRVYLAAGLEKSLSAYASAAVAAGVSLAAMAASAEAKIVYTPARTAIPLNGRLLLDLNHDGIADFILRNVEQGFSALSVGCAGTSQVPLPNGSACNYPANQIWGRGQARLGNRFASALLAGFKVRPNKSYFTTPNYTFPAAMGFFGTYRDSTSTRGQWLNTKNRYLGLQFVIKGQAHYGWARLTVLVQQPSLRGRGIYAVLTGYAYETIPNKSILTGKTKGPDVITLDPATLGHLAGGTSQIPAWRGERNRSGDLEDSRRKTGQGSQTAP